MGFAMLAIMGLVIGLVCDYYLYLAAKRERRSPWLGGILGSLFNVIGLLAFRLAVGPVVKA